MRCWSMFLSLFLSNLRLGKMPNLAVLEDILEKSVCSVFAACFASLCVDKPPTLAV